MADFGFLIHFEEEKILKNGHNGPFFSAKLTGQVFSRPVSGSTMQANSKLDRKLKNEKKVSIVNFQDFAVKSGPGFLNVYDFKIFLNFGVYGPILNILGPR